MGPGVPSCRSSMLDRMPAARSTSLIGVPRLVMAQTQLRLRRSLAAPTVGAPISMTSASDRWLQRSSEGATLLAHRSSAPLAPGARSASQLSVGALGTPGSGGLGEHDLPSSHTSSPIDRDEGRVVLSYPRRDPQDRVRVRSSIQIVASQPSSTHLSLVTDSVPTRASIDHRGESSSSTSRTSPSSPTCQVMAARSSAAACVNPGHPRVGPPRPCDPP